MTNPYQEALNQHQSFGNQNEGGAKSGVDWTFAHLPQPGKNKGEQATASFRFLPRYQFVDGRPNWEAIEPGFWAKSHRHKYHKDGKISFANCWDADRRPSDPVTCPMCIAREELIAEQRAKGGKNCPDQTFWNAAMKMGVQRRFYSNVIELDNPAVHWTVGEDGGHQVASHVLGYGATVYEALLGLCVNKTPVEDPYHGLDIKVVASRTGRESYDVSYQLYDSAPGPISEALMPVLHGLQDISGLGKPASEDQVTEFLAAMDPRAKAQGSSHQVPASYPPTAPSMPAPPKPEVRYHYAGPSGQLADQTVSQIHALMGTPGAHHVWDGQQWRDASSVVGAPQHAHPTAPPPLAAPPAPTGGPGYVPQGGYPVGASVPQPGPAQPAAPAQPQGIGQMAPPPAAAQAPAPAAPPGPPTQAAAQMPPGAPPAPQQGTPAAPPPPAQQGPPQAPAGPPKPPGGSPFNQ